MFLIKDIKLNSLNSNILVVVIKVNKILNDCNKYNINKQPYYNVLFNIICIIVNINFFNSIY